MNAMAPDKIVWQDLQRYVSPLVPNRFAYMTDAENARVEGIRQRRMLFRGRHRDYFLGENRTQFPVAQLMVNGQPRGVYVPYNLLGLISRKGADLLFGEHPTISCKEPAVQTAIEDISQRSHLRRVLFEAATACSWAADAFLEVLGNEDGAYLTTVPSDEVFPVGNVGPNGQYASYRRYATVTTGTAEQPITLLLITTYRRGEVSRELWLLNRSGEKELQQELKAWPPYQETGVIPEPIEKTGLDACSIIWIPNELIEGEAVSEYDITAIELQDLVNSKNSQLARILAIHANPRMYFPTGSADDDGKIRATDEAFFGDTKDAMPQYIPFVGDPKAAMEDREFAVASLCVSTEMTPELLGIKNNATADSARKMRLGASSPLAKVERRTGYWQPALQLAMTLAVRIELGRPIDMTTIGVEIRDGLPDDEIDTAEVIAMLRSADLLSDERGLSMLGLDAGAIDEEIKRLQAKRAADMPTVFNELPGTLPGEPPVAGSNATSNTPQGEGN